MPMSTATAMAVGRSIRGRVGGAVPGPSVKAPSDKALCSAMDLLLRFPRVSKIVLPIAVLAFPRSTNTSDQRPYTDTC